MKKVERTKEEKREIRQFKAEERQKVLGREKTNLKREHLYLAGAVIVLVLLVITLIYMLFFSKRKDLIVPDLPTYDNVDVGVVDFSDSSAKSDDLNSKKTNSLSVTYDIVSDYYKEGILLSNTQVDYLNNEFIVTSGPLSKVSFISSITKDGKLKWLTKLDDKEYGSVHIYKVITLNNNYYVAAITEKDNISSLSVIKLSLDGKRLATSVVKNNITDKIKDIIYCNNKMALVTTSSKDINIYFSDEELKSNKNELTISKYIDNSSYLNYQNATVVDNKLSLIINNSEAFYTANIDVDGYTVEVLDMEEVNTLKTDATLRIGSYLDGFTGYTNLILYKFDKENKLINKFDYGSIKLEDDTVYKESHKDDEYIDVEEMENSIIIETINSNDDSIIVNAKTIYSSIYDIYDSNLMIKKRIILDAAKYTYDDGVILNSFYIDGSIYEIYSYGTETPSIMISKIG